MKNEKGKIVRIIFVLMIFVSGCTASDLTFQMNKTSTDESSLRGSTAAAPEIYIERAIVESIRTDPRAVESVLGSGTQYSGADVVIARIESVRIKNKDNVSLPANVTSGETITLVFLRSTQKARIINKPMESGGETSEATNGANTQGEFGSEVMSVNQTGDEIRFYIHNPDVESRTTQTLPGLQAGDRFTAPAHVRSGAFVVVEYNRTS